MPPAYPATTLLPVYFYLGTADVLFPGLRTTRTGLAPSNQTEGRIFFTTSRSDVFPSRSITVSRKMMESGEILITTPL